MPEDVTSGMSNASCAGDVAATEAISPELVSQVADRVYAMLLADLRIEQERCRLDFSARPASGEMKWR